MTEHADIHDVLSTWQLPEGSNLLDRVEDMIRPSLLAGRFGASFTRYVSGLQYHLGGVEDTRQLASLANISCSDLVLDVCCFIGGPALQLAHTLGCHVTGVDQDANAIAAAAHIAQLAGLPDRLRFEVADAARLPFTAQAFTVIWNQCSLESNESWLEEFDRVLSPGGRFAFTFQRKGSNDTRWTLHDMMYLLDRMGYTVTHAEDITQRDIEIGWRALERKLSQREEIYKAALGDEWVHQAHQAFRTEITRMSMGEYGNARVVATKKIGT